MNEAEKYLKNAESCIELAEQAKTAPAQAQYRRMADAWLVLAKEQGWLDGDVPPLPGAHLQISDTWKNTTLTTLGLSMGAYVYTWGTGAHSDTLTINLVPSASPST